MQKSARELIKLARSEGLEDVRVEQGVPHGRMHGTYKGKPFSMVISLSKPADHYGGPQVNRSNIRKLKRTLENRA
jgi:hypothetical protein